MSCSLKIFVTFLFFDLVSGLEIFKTVEAVLGDVAELPCNVTAENQDEKLNILAWYRNNSSSAFYSSRDLRGTVDNKVSEPDRRYQLITTETGVDILQIDAVRHTDDGLYRCVVVFESSPIHKTFVQLTVIDPPHHLWVINENGSHVAKASAGVNISQNIGPYYVGDTVHLFCVAFGGKPKASLSWWSDQRLLKNTSTTLSEQRERSDLLYGPLRGEDHGRILTCFASNNKHTLPLSIDIIIDMFLPPDLVSIRGMKLVSKEIFTGWFFRNSEQRVGDNLLLQCREQGARPTPPITWKIDNVELSDVVQNISVEQSQRFVVSELQLKVTFKHDESQITCCVPAYKRDEDGVVCAEPLTLTVLHAPVLEILVDQDVENGSLTLVKGSNVTMGCSYVAHPDLEQLVWFHEDDIVSESKGNSTILELQDVKESDAGEYVCAGTNVEGSTYSEPINIDVTYPAYCINEENTIEYGIGEAESMNLTCNVRGNPEPTSFRWIIVNDAVDVNAIENRPHTETDTDQSTMLYQRSNDTTYNTIFCWGLNDVTSKSSPHTPCRFIVTDKTKPRPPSQCIANKTIAEEIVISCEMGHSGGMSQKFKFAVTSLDSKEQFVSIENVEPNFIIPEPKQAKYKFVITAFNDKGASQPVEIKQDEIFDWTEEPDKPLSAVMNITTLSLALYGAVALIVLAACGLVLCARERGSRVDLPRAHSDPPLCAYNTDELNNDNFNGSDDGSECNIRRSESFRRAVSRYPSKNFDVRRTSSFHSARYMNDFADESASKYVDNIRHSTNCRVHSLQNISRKREMDGLCDHLVLHLPPEPNYNVPKPMNTFYTMPRKMRHKSGKELCDDRSEITQTSDGFSLPPPPDEFGTYRAATRIKDMPIKSTPTYTTIVRNNSGKESARHQFHNTINSPMNAVGVPSISGPPSLYTYSDEQGHQVNTNPFDEDSS